MRIHCVRRSEFARGAPTLVRLTRDPSVRISFEYTLAIVLVPSASATFASASSESATWVRPSSLNGPSSKRTASIATSSARWSSGFNGSPVSVVTSGPEHAVTKVEATAMARRCLRMDYADSRGSVALRNIDAQSARSSGDSTPSSSNSSRVNSISANPLAVMRRRSRTAGAST